MDERGAALDAIAKSRQVRKRAKARMPSEGIRGNINDHIAMHTDMLQDPLRSEGFARTMITFYVHMRDRHGAQTVDGAYQLLERGQVTDVSFLRGLVNSAVLSDTHRITSAIRTGGYKL